MGNKTNTTSAFGGTGGNNLPLVLHTQGNFKPHAHEGRSGTLLADSWHPPMVEQKTFTRGGIRNPHLEDDKSMTLTAHDRKDARTNLVMEGESYIRKLTPLECERLQGFPDNWTNIPWRGGAQAPNGLRYEAIGNSMAVPVMRWIGRRIQKVADLIEARKGSLHAH